MLENYACRDGSLGQPAVVLESRSPNSRFYIPNTPQGPGHANHACELKIVVR